MQDIAANYMAGAPACDRHRHEGWDKSWCGPVSSVSSRIATTTAGSNQAATSCCLNQSYFLVAVNSITTQKAQASPSPATAIPVSLTVASPLKISDVSRSLMACSVNDDLFPLTAAANDEMETTAVDGKIDGGERKRSSKDEKAVDKGRHVSSEKKTEEKEKRAKKPKDKAQTKQQQQKDYNGEVLGIIGVKITPRTDLIDDSDLPPADNKEFIKDGESKDDETGQSHSIDLAQAVVGEKVAIAVDYQTKSSAATTAVITGEGKDPWLQGEVLRFCVAKEARGRGIGRSLLEAAEQWAVAHRCSSLSVSTLAGLTSAVSLYEAVGFVVAKEQELSPGLILLQMRKQL